VVAEAATPLGPRLVRQSVRSRKDGLARWACGAVQRRPPSPCTPVGHRPVPGRGVARLADDAHEVHRLAGRPRGAHRGPEASGRRDDFVDRWPADKLHRSHRDGRRRRRGQLGRHRSDVHRRRRVRRRTTRGAGRHGRHQNHCHGKTPLHTGNVPRTREKAGWGERPRLITRTDTRPTSRSRTRPETARTSHPPLWERRPGVTALPVEPNLRHAVCRQSLSVDLVKARNGNISRTKLTTGVLTVTASSPLEPWRKSWLQPWVHEPSHTA